MGGERSPKVTLNFSRGFQIIDLYLDCVEAASDPGKIGHNVIILDIYIPPPVLRKIHGSELGLNPNENSVLPETVFFAR